MQELKSHVRTSCAFIKEQAGAVQPRVGIIFGSGLSSLESEIQDSCTIPYDTIPHFVTSTVEGHRGELVLGRLEGQGVVAMRGRFHAYEGYTFQQITYPVRVMKALGVETLMISNACGVLNPMWRVGDLMLLDDHINLMQGNPLIGVNDQELGPRFPDMSEPYDRQLMALAEHVAREHHIRLQQGVYAAVTGPNLETRAEYRFLRTIGADVVGMSTVPECLAAIHGGQRVLGISVITDACLPDRLKPASLEEILKVAAEAEPKLNTIFKGVLAAL